MSTLPERVPLAEITETLRRDREAERANLELVIQESEAVIKALREHHLAAVQSMQDQFNHTIEAMTGIFDRLVVNEENRIVVMRQQVSALDAADGNNGAS